jgi:hypothetical protein
MISKKEAGMRKQIGLGLGFLGCGMAMFVPTMNSGILSLVVTAGENQLIILRHVEG